MRILFESLGIDRDGSPEARNAWRFANYASSYADVAAVVPEARAHQAARSLPHAQLIAVPYDLPRLPLNGGLQYTYGLFAARARSAVRASGFDPDIVHRLNPFAMRHSSAFRRWDSRLVLGPLGGSVLPPGFSRPRDLPLRALKRIDIARLTAPMGALRQTYDAADAIVCATASLKERLPEQYRSRVTILCEGVDCDVFRMAPFDPSSTRIVFAGRLVPFKGLDYLIRALADCLDLDWQLRIVGDGPMKSSLRRLARQLGVLDRTAWLGWVDAQTMRTEYAAARFVCSPGVNESTGNVIMEALASGRPVLVADWAGPHELVPDEAGVKASVARGPGAYAAELASGARRLLEDEAMCRSMSLAARDHAERRLDWPWILERMAELHHRVAQEQRGRY